MTPDRFEHLLSIIRPAIRRQDTNFRKTIEPGQCLALTLRFLADFFLEIRSNRYHFHSESAEAQFQGSLEERARLYG